MPLSLGIEGFTYADLYDPFRPKVLAEYFYQEVEAADPVLGQQYIDFRVGKVISPVDESNLIIKLAPYLGRFIAWLFQIEDPVEVDFPNLNARLKQNSVQEKLTNLWLDYLLKKKMSSGYNPETLLDQCEN